ncbi:hypothetical protein [Mangrovibacillus cuniculi]|uniref:Uncharacterized protein n=1 Tax=Mangrovibacillus cuniculi TaxID=2593652 RepID=A0A7S8C9N3_9BACI|nr:hypothetical protein [Mangrovibacillus cuniculi]QPC45991.1 hypothetical protein G8O30_02980 [Mangrovibacillus cuniculi]
MEWMIFFVFLISFIGLSVAVHFVRMTLRPSLYPPKHIAKKHAVLCAAIGIIFLFLGFLLIFLQGPTP